MGDPAEHDEHALDALYKTLILDHHQSPRNSGAVDDPTVEVRMLNPTCGDEITLTLRVEAGHIAEVRHDTRGCSISRAAGSMMTQLLEDRSLADADGLADRFTEMMHGDEAAKQDPSLGDLRALAGVSKFPVRVKCALLSFEALQEALEKVGGTD